MELSEKIRILRRKNGWSQEELGYKLSNISNDGISRQAVSDWENGKSEPKLDNIRQLAELFNVSFDSLLNENIDITKTNSEYDKPQKEDTKKEIFSSSKTYYLRYLKIDWLDYLFILIIPILLILIVIFAIKSKHSNEDFSVLLIFLGATFMMILPGHFTVINKFITHKGSSITGELNDNYLVLYNGGKDHTKYMIPLENIISIRLGKYYRNVFGTVHFQIKGREHESTISYLASPKTFIETFNKYKKELLNNK